MMASLVKETLQITPFTHKRSHAALFMPSGAGREMQGGQADETFGLFFFVLFFSPSVVVVCAFVPSLGVSARQRSAEACLSGPDQRNTAEQQIPFTVPQRQGQAV